MAHCQVTQRLGLAQFPRVPGTSPWACLGDLTHKLNLVVSGV